MQTNHTKFFSTHWAIVFFLLVHPVTNAQVQVQNNSTNKMVPDRALLEKIDLVTRHLQKYVLNIDRLHYTFEYSPENCTLFTYQHLEEKGRKVVIRYSLHLADFKALQLDGQALELLAHGSSIIKMEDGKRSAWSGFRLQYAQSPDLNALTQINKVFQEAAELAKKECH